ncbi:MAG: hypothetical protein M5R41_04695 [Bacteroidia bacterium]|nr:hypothetical protein [Bacteroidia bacterium]
MNTHNTLSADDLLHAWIDGELPTEQEPQFYSLLASDSVYRERLRQFQTIRRQALRYGVQATPPAELGTQLFERLGLPADEHRSSRTRVLPFFATFWSPIASAAAAAFLTAVIILGIQKNNTSFENASLAQQSGVAAPTPQTLAADPAPNTHPPRSLPSMKFVDARTASPASQVQPSPVQGVYNEAVSTDTPLEGETSPENGSVSTAENHSVESGNVPTPFRTDALETPIAGTSEAPDEQESLRPEAHPSEGFTAVNDLPVASGQRDELSGYRDGPAPFPQQMALSAADILTIEIRGTTASSFPRATIPSNPAPWMENMAIGVFYPDEHTDLGLEYGQEAFSQHYSGMENGKYVRYEQNLRSSWLIATVRQRMGRIESLAGFEPYASISAGATFELWPLLKGGFGLMYMPDNRVRFHIGLEGALLAFPYQEQWFTSKRAGITYGLSVLF